MPVEKAPEISTKIGSPPPSGGCYRLDDQGRRVRVKAGTPDPGPLRPAKGEVIPEMARPGFRDQKRGRRKVAGSEPKPAEGPSESE